MIRELFERVKSGHSLPSIALDFERHGIRTRSGKTFSPQHLRVLATTAAYAGLRGFLGGVLGVGLGASCSLQRSLGGKALLILPAAVSVAAARCVRDLIHRLRPTHVQRSSSSQSNGAPCFRRP